MSIEAAIVLILMSGLIIASDKFEFIKKRTEQYKELKDIYLTIAGLIIFGILIWVVGSNWDQIDFHGRGGNPQESYQDEY